MQIQEVNARPLNWKVKCCKRYPYVAVNDSLKRCDHSTFVWGKFMFVFGGRSSIQHNKSGQDESSLQRFDLESLQWDISQPQGPSPPKATRQSCILIRQELITFGGKLKNNCTNDIWAFNLFTSRWRKLPNEGTECPTARHSSSLMQTSNGLTIFGGVDFTGNKACNDMHVYTMDTRKWHPLICPKSRDPRSGQKMGQIKQNMYLFGGINQQGNVLNDIYRVSIDDMKTYQLLEIATKTKPAPRTGHCMTTLFDTYILIAGGQIATDQGTKLVNDAWLFDPLLEDWLQVDTTLTFQPRSLFSAIEYQGTLYIFGGTKNNETVEDSLVSLQFLDATQKQDQSCPLFDITESNTASFDFLMKSANLIKFPFAAIGLLVDNAINTQAHTVNITVNDKQLQLTSLKKPYPDRESTFHRLKGPDQTLRYIMIEDDGKSWNNEELPKIIFGAQFSSPLQTQITDKKGRFQAQKANIMKEFGNNLKLGSLRLGNGFLYVSHHETCVRAGLFTMNKNGNSQPDFTSVYYCHDIRQNKFLTKNGAETKRMIQKVCARFLRPKVLEQVFPKNQLYIFELRDFYTRQGIFYELNPYMNDCIYHHLPEVEFLQKIGFPIFECPDVSLRSYLSLLYLKVEANITLHTDGKVREEIFNQLFIDKIDRQKQKGYVKEIQYANEYPQLAECRIVELYFDQLMDARCNSFHSGILIYHRNRLICRYKYELGLIFQLKFYRRRYKMGQANVFRFFGYIQLPQSIQVNVLKTDVAQPMLLQSFNSNLRLIIKDIKRRIVAKARSQNAPGIVETQYNINRGHGYRNTSRINMDGERGPIRISSSEEEEDEDSQQESSEEEVGGSQELDRNPQRPGRHTAQDVGMEESKKKQNPKM